MAVCCLTKNNPFGLGYGATGNKLSCSGSYGRQLPWHGLDRTASVPAPRLYMKLALSVQSVVRLPRSKQPLLFINRCAPEGARRGRLRALGRN